MQQLFSAFGIDWRLLIIQGINFAILLGALTYFLYRPMMAMIDGRRAKIAEGVAAGLAATQRLADAQVEGEGIVGAAAREAETLVAGARTRAEQKAAQIASAADTRANNIVKEAEARAEEAKRKALVESQQQIARTAMLAAEKILRGNKA